MSKALNLGIDDSAVLTPNDFTGWKGPADGGGTDILFDEPLGKFFLTNSAHGK